MKKVFLFTSIIVAFNITNLYADIKVVSIKGEVAVRHGVQEKWIAVSNGDVLKPEDSMKLSRKSSATVIIDDKVRLTIPESVIIDLSDLRDLTQEELLLKLAMEQVRSIPSKLNEDGLIIPRTTTIHGENKDVISKSTGKNIEIGNMQLNGTKVLFDNGYYATCVLKTKEIFRSYLELAKKTDIRLMIGSALEKMDLYGEALGEYSSIPTEQLSKEQRSLVQKKIENLKKENQN